MCFAMHSVSTQSGATTQTGEPEKSLFFHMPVREIDQNHGRISI